MRVIWQQQVESWGGGREKVRAGFRWGNRKEKDHLEDTGTDGMIIFRW